jgi:CubicO group peptidase (beta-lactamase class C family)
MHADARAVTVQHLLTHRAGLPGGPPRDLWSRLWTWEGSMRDARTTIAAEMLAVAPEAAVGERFLYSNAGYMVAGAMLERIGDASWEDLMQRELFAPLGITSGGFGAPGDDKSTAQPWGHRGGKDGAEAQFGDNPKALGPAGTVHMTLRDWAKFALLHLGVPGSDGKLLLKTGTLADLHTLPPGIKDGGQYGLGWAVAKRPWAPGPILTHNGSNTMWFCVAWLAPEAKFGVLVTCNHGGGAKACDEVAAACIGRFAPRTK